MAVPHQEKRDILAPKTLRFFTLICVLYLIMSAIIDIRTHLPIPFYLLNYITLLAFMAFIYILLSQKKINHENTGLFLFILLSAATTLILILSNYAAFRFGLIPMTSPESQAIKVFPILALTLIVITWFYPRRHILVFCAIILATQIIHNFWIHGFHRFEFFHAGVVAISQTAMFLILGLMLEMMLRNIRQQRNELSYMNSRLIRQATAQRQLTISQERNRMARELHDTLAHTLSGLTVQLETVKAYWDVDLSTANDMLEQSLSTARNGLNETRRSLQALRAGPLEDLGLILALKGLVDSATRQTNMKSQLEFPENLPVLDPEYDQCVFRISQEAITNITRHSKATLMTLKLNVDQDRIELEIKDNGVGFHYSSQETTGHFGIAGMKERAELIGGELKISSSPEEGTAIYFTKKTID
jgi:signal transduction histidine kinase